MPFEMTANVAVSELTSPHLTSAVPSTDQSSSLNTRANGPWRCGKKLALKASLVVPGQGVTGTIPIIMTWPGSVMRAGTYGFQTRKCCHHVHVLGTLRSTLERIDAGWTSLRLASRTSVRQENCVQFSPMTRQGRAVACPPVSLAPVKRPGTQRSSPPYSPPARVESRPEPARDRAPTRHQPRQDQLLPEGADREGLHQGTQVHPQSEQGRLCLPAYAQGHRGQDAHHTELP